MSGISRNQTQASQSVVILCADGAILPPLLYLSERKIVTYAQMEYCFLYTTGLTGKFWHLSVEVLFQLWTFHEWASEWLCVGRQRKSILLYRVGTQQSCPNFDIGVYWLTHSKLKLIGTFETYKWIQTWVLGIVWCYRTCGLCPRSGGEWRTLGTTLCCAFRSQKGASVSR